MGDQTKIPEELLPKWDDMTEWQRCVCNAIEEIQDNWKPYQRPGGAGCTQDRYFRGSRFLRAAIPPVSYCCGAQLEAFYLAWKEWMGELFESKDDMSLEQMKILYSYSFVFSGIPNNEMGLAAPDALPSLPLWVPLFKDEGVKVQVIASPRHARFGDFCQIQNGPDPESGHSVIILGVGKWKDQDVLHVWSSNMNYDQSWPYSAGQQDGHGVDYYYIDRQIKQKDGSYWSRKFHLVRIAD